LGNNGSSAITKNNRKKFFGVAIADLDDNLWEIAFNPFLPLDEKGNTIESK